MSLDGSFKVESSFPSRGNKKSEGSYVSSRSPGLLQSDSSSSSSSNMAQQHDPNEFLTSDIIYQSPYDNDSNHNISYELGPQVEEGSRSESNHSNWAELPDWSINPLQLSSVLLSKDRLKRTQDLTQTSMSWMNLPVPAMNLNEDDPLVFLKSQETKILSNLNELLQRHSEFLAKGQGKVKKVRSIILNQLNQLHEVHQAMNEIYVSERANRVNLLQKFQDWEFKKQQLLTKINDIQSDSNEEGVRYRQLLDQSNDINSQIDDLELKLKQLKQKRSVVRKELDSSQSVIQSRASSYIESLDIIETDERNVINKLSNTQISMSLPDIVVPTNVSAPNSSKDSEDETLNILELSKLNISKFFSNSEKMASKISPLETFKPQVDVTKVVDSLRLQVDAISDELEKQETSSFKFQESTIIWGESVGNVSLMENSLKLSNNIDELFILKNLEDTVELLSKRLEIASKLQLSIVKSAIVNEMSTIQKALYIITKDDKYLPSGFNTPSSLSSNSDNTRKIRKSSSSSSFPTLAVNSGGLKIPTNNHNHDSNPLFKLNTASPPAATFASSGPPIILSSSINSQKRKSSMFGNLGLNEKKNVKKD